MKKIFVVLAVLIAVVASTGIGGVRTASAFNPQPEPPAMTDDNVQNFVQDFWSTEILAMTTAIRDGRAEGEKIGTVVTNNLPSPGKAPGLNRPLR